MYTAEKMRLWGEKVLGRQRKERLPMAAGVKTAKVYNVQEYARSV